MPSARGFRVPTPTKDVVPQPQGPLTVQGQPAGSSIEYNVAAGLAKLKIAYHYQYPILGGRQVRGGSVIDFFVYTVPMPTPLYVQGDYWHGSATKRIADQWLMRRIQAILHYQCVDPAEIWEHEALTIDMAMANLRRILHI